jgi:hypothetical protein
MAYDTHKMYDMVTDIFGAAVYPVKPYLLHSTDNTTEYISEGTLKQFDPCVITKKSSLLKRGTNAVYKYEDNNSMSGMHIKLTFTFSAMGTCMPLVCTVNDLTERERCQRERSPFMSKLLVYALAMVE